jgi:hypothetical protein
MHLRQTFSLDNGLLGAIKDEPQANDQLHFLARMGDSAAIENYVRVFPESINHFHSVHGTTPICWAIQEGNDTAVITLLNLGANLLLTATPLQCNFPLSFYKIKLPEIQTDAHKFLLAKTKAALSLCSDPSALSDGDLFNFIQGSWLVMSHEFYLDYPDLIVMKNQLLSLTGILLARLAGSAQLKADIHLLLSAYLFHNEVAVYQEMISYNQVNVMSADDSHHFIDEVEAIENEIDEKLDLIPGNDRDADLSIALLIQTSHPSLHSIDDSDLDLELYYNISLRLIDDASLSAVILIKKSIFYLVYDDLEMALESLADALVRLQLINTKNSYLAAFLFVSVLEIYNEDEIVDNNILIKLLELSLQLDNNTINRCHFGIALEIIRLKHALNANAATSIITQIFTRTSQYFVSLPQPSSLDYHHRKFLDVELSLLGNEMISHLKSNYQDEEKFLLTSHCLSYCIRILHHYSSATYMAPETEKLEKRVHDLMINFDNEILKNPDILIRHMSHHIMFLQFQTAYMRSVIVMNMLADIYIKANRSQDAIAQYKTILALSLDNYDLQSFFEASLALHKEMLKLNMPEASYLILFNDALVLLQSNLSLNCMDHFLEVYKHTVASGHKWLASLYSAALEILIRVAMQKCSSEYQREFIELINELKFKTKCIGQSFQPRAEVIDNFNFYYTDLMDRLGVFRNASGRFETDSTNANVLPAITSPLLHREVSFQI